MWRADLKVGPYGIVGATNGSVYAALNLRVAMPWSREAGVQRPALVMTAPAVRG